MMIQSDELIFFRGVGFNHQLVHIALLQMLRTRDHMQETCNLLEEDKKKGAGR
jgi:hypothetical protein